MTDVGFRGALVALVTPFDARGRIDVLRLQQLVQWQIAEGTEGLVCAGATGESMTLSELDRKKVLQTCLEAAENKIPIIAGTGTSDTKQTVRLTEVAQKMGAAGCLIITPYYNKPTQRGCLLHFQAISCVGLPIVIYNNPPRTIVQLQPQTIAEIALLPNVVALKEASNDSQFVSKVRALTSLPILAGDDTLTFGMLQEGAAGAISVVGNLLPALWKQMIQLARASKWSESKKIFDRVLPLCQALFLETNPQCVKYAVSLTGKCHSRMRLPLVEPTEAVREEVKKALLAFNLPLISGREEHSKSLQRR